MSANRDVPEPWAALLVRAGLVDTRNGAASMTRLSEESGVHASTISAMMYGDRRPKNATLDKLADAIAGKLGYTDSTDIRGGLYEWADRALEEDTPFEPHPDADLLNKKERAAVNELIRLLALSKRGGVVVQMPQKPTPKSPPTGSQRELPAARKTGKPTARQRKEAKSKGDDTEPR